MAVAADDGDAVTGFEPETQQASDEAVATRGHLGVGQLHAVAAHGEVPAGDGRCPPQRPHRRRHRTPVLRLGYPAPCSARAANLTSDASSFSPVVARARTSRAGSSSCVQS